LKNEIDLGIEQVKKSLELDPNFPGAHRILSLAYLKQQRYQQATAEFEKAVELSGRGSEALGELGYCYGIRGKCEDALWILKELDAKYASRESPGYQLAAVYVAWMKRI
jgi:Flp pilus assembly protein TadD